MKIIYLIPRSGYVTDLRSDTLWGTLCWGIQYLWSEADENGETELTKFIRRCAAGNPDFVITSAFPYKQHGKERIPFFPNPFLLAPEDDDTDLAKARDAYRLRKKLKKIKYLSLDDFREALHGRLSSGDLLNRLREDYQRKMDAVEAGKDYTPMPQTVEQTAPQRHDHSMTHSTIDRLRGGTLSIQREVDGEMESAGQLFHAEDIWWADPHNDSDAARPNTGLFFLAHGDTSKLEAVLRLLRHLGIGADRTAGKGAFIFEVKDFTEEFAALEPPVTGSNALLNLSLFRPTKDELQKLEDTDSCWQYLLERREGFVGGYREARPKTPRMYFQEGSVFQRPEAYQPRHMGGIHRHDFPELPHEVWDNGFGFMVNLNWKKQ